MVQEGSYIYDRARFVQHNLWVTKYDAAEKFAAGDYMYQSADVQGLPQFIADDAPLENTDVVLWYTLGAHHVVRPEDWPVMPVRVHGLSSQAARLLRRQSRTGHPTVTAEGLPPPLERFRAEGRQHLPELAALSAGELTISRSSAALTPASVCSSTARPSRVS